MNIRLIGASAAAALGLVFSSGAEARTVVVYGAPAVIYAPPPRSVYYSVPLQPTYVTVVAAPAPVVVVPAPKPAPTVYVPAPKPAPMVYVPVAGGYAAVPAANASYAQPVVAVPVAGMH